MPNAYFLSPHPGCVGLLGSLNVPTGFPQDTLHCGSEYQNICICRGNFNQPDVDSPPPGVTRLTEQQVRDRVELVLDATV